MSEPAFESAGQPTPVRVALLTSPALYGAAIVNILAEHPGIDLVAVGLTNRVFKRQAGIANTVTRLIRRSGFRYFWHNARVSNFAWNKLRRSGRPAGLDRPELSLRPIDDVNSESTVEWLGKCQPDYIASFYFNQWIGPAVRQQARRSCVNLHPSLLPALQGPDPAFRALQRNLTQTGVSIHVVEDDFDSGNVLYQEPCEIPPGTSLMGLYWLLVQRGAVVLADWLTGRLPADSVPREPSASAAVAAEARDYQSFPTRAELREFLRGHALEHRGELRQALRQID